MVKGYNAGWLLAALNWTAQRGRAVADTCRFGSALSADLNALE
jgi:hypothetical protein